MKTQDSFRKDTTDHWGNRPPKLKLVIPSPKFFTLIFSIENQIVTLNSSSPLGTSLTEYKKR